MNESRSPDALDRRIDDALRRRFAVPASVDTLAARARPRPRRALRLGVAFAAAAAVVFVLWWAARPESAGALGADEPEVARRPVPVHTGSTPIEADAVFCRLIGPMLEGQPEPGSVHRPDLVRLYRDMDACLRESSAVACGDGDFLAERLSATYGQELALRPEAAGLLHGPFGSDEWPTGTIVAGTSDELTSVLVADRDTTLACCVRMKKLPDSAGLQLFYWQVGEVLLTEITPRAEPWLLAYFQ